MSVYGINKVGYEILHDPDFRERVLDDPTAALEGRDLDDDEKSAILSADVGSLYHMGAHEYLLFNVAQAHAFGLTVPDFITRMRAAGSRPSHDDTTSIRATVSEPEEGK